MTDSYISIGGPASGEYKEKGSKFLAYAYPMNQEEEMPGILAAVKSEHPKARHYCYAYRLGLAGDIFRINDDGEPSGTAGKPIHGQLLSFEVSDVLVIVVRYFGGTKLGASGLIHAYKTAAFEALQTASKVEKILTNHYKLTFSMSETGHVFHVMKTLNIPVSDTLFDENAVLTIGIRLSREKMLLDELKAKLLRIPVEQAKTTTHWAPFILEKIA
jgi:uncharacterized YigZ family protein